MSLFQCLVSLRRIDAYLDTPEVELAAALEDATAVADAEAQQHHDDAQHPQRIAFDKATITFPQDRRDPDADEPETKPFELQDVEVEFPVGELSLICGRLGSGKTLMLLCASLFLSLSLDAPGLEARTPQADSPSSRPQRFSARSTSFRARSRALVPRPAPSRSPRLPGTPTSPTTTGSRRRTSPSSRSRRGFKTPRCATTSSSACRSARHGTARRSRRVAS